MYLGHHLGLFDDETLVPFFPAQHLQRDLLEFRQLRKLDDFVAVQLHPAVFQIRVFLEYRQPRLQGQFMPRGPKEMPASALIRNAHGVTDWKLFVNGLSSAGLQPLQME